MRTKDLPSGCFQSNFGEGSGIDAGRKERIAIGKKKVKIKSFLPFILKSLLPSMTFFPMNELSAMIYTLYFHVILECMQVPSPK